MQLFDHFERNESAYARQIEPAYNYLNRAASPEAAVLRAELESWFDRYYRPDQVELCAAFRSRDNNQHLAALLELLLHETLLRLGCVIEVHPTLARSSRHPDFLVTEPDGSQFYLEAKVAVYESAQEAAARARKNEVYAALDRAIKTTDFFLWLETEGRRSHRRRRGSWRTFSTGS